MFVLCLLEMNQFSRKKKYQNREGVTLKGESTDGKFDRKYPIKSFVVYVYEM